jgi:hypothetical protein
MERLRGALTGVAGASAAGPPKPVAQLQHCVSNPQHFLCAHPAKPLCKMFSGNDLKEMIDEQTSCTTFALHAIVGSSSGSGVSLSFSTGRVFMKIRSRMLMVASVAALAMPSVLSAQIWTNWTSGTGIGGVVTGSLGGISVDITGNISAYQLANGSETGPFSTPGQQYWNPSNAFTQGGLIAPTAFGLIQSDRDGLMTVTFGGLGVLNPYIAINSLGRPNVNTGIVFSGAGANLLSSNDGGVPAYWGTGTCTLVGQTLTGSECSGVVQLSGVYTSLTITSTLPVESWDGLTIGAQSVVPEPSTYVLFASGLVGLGLLSRRRRSA